MKLKNWSNTSLLPTWMSNKTTWISRNSWLNRFAVSLSGNSSNWCHRSESWSSPWFSKECFSFLDMRRLRSIFLEPINWIGNMSKISSHTMSFMKNWKIIRFKVQSKKASLFMRKSMCFRKETKAKFLKILTTSIKDMLWSLTGSTWLFKSVWKIFKKEKRNKITFSKKEKN